MPVLKVSRQILLWDAGTSEPFRSLPHALRSLSSSGDSASLKGGIARGSLVGLPT